MYTALALATLVNSAFATAPIGANDGTYGDRSAMVRAFHSEAMVVTGGNFAFDMVPVQADGRRAFVMSDAFEDPDAPMGAGNGWLFVRDAAGNGTMVLVTNKTSLSDLETALDGAPDIEAEFAIAYDEYGAHLVGVLDSHGQSAFERNVVQYRPAPRWSPSLRRCSLLVPSWPSQAQLDVDISMWEIDTDTQWGSSAGDGLRMQDAQRKGSFPPTFPTQTAGAPLDGHAEQDEWLVPCGGPGHEPGGELGGRRCGACLGAAQLRRAVRRRQRPVALRLRLDVDGRRVHPRRHRHLRHLAAWLQLGSSVSTCRSPVPSWTGDLLGRRGEGSSSRFSSSRSVRRR